MTQNPENPAKVNSLWSRYGLIMALGAWFAIVSVLPAQTPQIGRFFQFMWQPFFLG